MTTNNSESGDDGNIAGKYRGIYGEGAKDYDSSRFGARGHYYSKLLKNRVVRDLLDEEGVNDVDKLVLDLASGTGRIAHDLITETKVSVIGADLTIEMLQVSRKNMPRACSERLEFLVTDMRKLALEADSVDAVTIGSFFYLVPEADYGGFVADIRRVLKPGGVLVCEVSNAFNLLSPLTFLKNLVHKYVKKKPIKSYAMPWHLARDFSPFRVDRVIGVDFPFAFLSYPRFEWLSRVLGRIAPFRYVGGKYIVVLRN